MDLETGCGLPSTGLKARLLIGTVLMIMKFYWSNCSKAPKMNATPFNYGLSAYDLEGM